MSGSDKRGGWVVMNDTHQFLHKYTWRKAGRIKCTHFFSEVKQYSFYDGATKAAARADKQTGRNDFGVLNIDDPEFQDCIFADSVFYRWGGFHQSTPIDRIDVGKISQHHPENGFKCTVYGSIIAAPHLDSIAIHAAQIGQIFFRNELDCVRNQIGVMKSRPWATSSAAVFDRHLNRLQSLLKQVEIK